MESRLLNLFAIAPKCAYQNWRVPILKTGKEEVLELLEQLPEDASIEDIQYHIFVRQKIQRGLDAAREGKVIALEEVEKRMARWLEK